MAFAHLHVHSEYSLLDGAVKVEALARRCRELGMASLALTDHGNLHGSIEFYDACLKHGVKPILGMEAYVAPGSRRERSSKHGLSDAAYHLVLLARDLKGWENLIQLSSLGYLEGYYYRPRIDLEILAKHAEGLIGLSGCLSGEIPSLLLKQEAIPARQRVEDFQRIFGRENFFLEVQDHGIPEERRLLPELKQLSRDTGAPLVATNDSHYLSRDMHEAHEVLLCIQTGSHLEDPGRLHFDGEEFYLKSEREMQELFPEDPEILERSAAIAARCHLVLERPRLALPRFETPPGQDEAGLLESYCRAALPKKYPSPTALHEERLALELGVIGRLGFSGYFLVVKDFIDYARSQGIRVGPGRGSAAGSLVSYLCGITGVDPIACGLLFERFLNPERSSPPDIDVDFADDRRDEVIDYVAKKYGHERVAGIISFGTLGAKAVVRDVGRVLNYAYGEVDQLAKMIPYELDISLESALEKSAELQAAAQEPRAARLLGLARKLEGMARNASRHAAGVVISPEPLLNRVPLCLDRAAESGQLDAARVTQFDMASLERLGLLKMDFLGLRNLRVIDNCLRLLGSQAPDLEQLKDEDPESFAMLGRGVSHGVFQLESAGMKDLLRRFQPKCLEDLDQLIALYRPGPMRNIDSYLRRRSGKEKIETLLPEMQPILKRTYGIIVYQEQVMQIAVAIGGVSLGQADSMRRAMSKKDPELLEKQRQVFESGAKAKGLKAEDAEALFDLLAEFASYGFNKSHSAAYALLAYQTAYLKAHHPEAFLCALLSSESGSVERVVATLAECRRLGIAILPPDANQSEAAFSVEKGKIRIGLGAIRNVGLQAMESLVEERHRGEAFKDMDDFLARIDAKQMGSRMLESLIKAGALDGLYQGPRAWALAELPERLGQAARIHEDRRIGQTSLFEGEALASPRPAHPQKGSEHESAKLAYEKEVLGFYVSGHPLERYAALLEWLAAEPLTALKEKRDGAPVLLGGVLLSLRQQSTKRGEAFARAQLEDFEGITELLLWPKVWEKARTWLKPEAMVALRGRVDLSGDEVKVSVEEIVALETAPQRLGKALRVELEAGAPASAEALKAWIAAHPGKLPLLLQWQHGGESVLQRLGAAHGVTATKEALEALQTLEGIKIHLET